MSYNSSHTLRRDAYCLLVSSVSSTDLLLFSKSLVRIFVWGSRYEIVIYINIIFKLFQWNIDSIFGQYFQFDGIIVKELDYVQIVFLWWRERWATLKANKVP